jgi:hypothetical protein
MNAEGEEVPNPDPSAGLYIRSRAGALVRVMLPPGGSTLAFQIGETSQIHTGGILQVGLGRIVALHHRSSTLYHIH